MRLAVPSLAALAAGLAAILAVELASGGDGPASLAPLPAASPANSATRRGSGVDPAALQAWSAQILARPLFSPSRRPGRVAVASTELPRLAGIVIGPAGDRRAIFALSGDARALVAGPGGHAGPYLVRDINAGGVSVLGPNGPQLLHPAWDHATPHDDDQAPAEPQGQPSILDLLRSRVPNGGGLRSALLPPGVKPLQPANRNPPK